MQTKLKLEIGLEHLTKTDVHYSIWEKEEHELKLYQKYSQFWREIDNGLTREVIRNTKREVFNINLNKFVNFDENKITLKIFIHQQDEGSPDSYLLIKYKPSKLKEELVPEKVYALYIDRIVKHVSMTPVLENLEELV